MRASNPGPFYEDLFIYKYFLSSTTDSNLLCFLGPLASAFGFYFYASPDLYAEFLIFFHSIVYPFHYARYFALHFSLISFISSHFNLSSHRIYLFYSPELHYVSASSTANRDTSLYASSIKSFSNNALAIVQYYFYDIPDLLPHTAIGTHKSNHLSVLSSFFIATHYSLPMHIWTRTNAKLRLQRNTSMHPPRN